jgi:hypothetical protein
MCQAFRHQPVFILLGPLTVEDVKTCGTFDPATQRHMPEGRSVQLRGYENLKIPKSDVRKMGSLGRIGIGLKRTGGRQIDRLH